MRWLSFSLIVVVLVATIGLGWVFDVVYQQYSESLPSETQDDIEYAETLTRQLAVTLAKNDNPQQFVEDWQQGNEYALQMLPLTELALPQSLINSLEQGHTLNLESDTDISIHFMMPNSDNVLILHIPNLAQSEPKDSGRYWITSVFYVLLIALFLLWVRPLVTRLLRLRKAATSFGNGELSKRISVGKVSYISDLETEFNHMAQRIEDLVSDVKLLSSAVSHDLRTPLARIRMGLDTLSEESDPQKRQAYEARINDNIDDMVELIEVLLSYARLEQAMLVLEKQPVDLNQLLQTVIDKKFSADKSIEFAQPTQGDVYLVSGDKSYLKMLCNNLLLNAIQHARQKVQIDLQHNEQHIVLRIVDDGPGIAPDIASNIFKPFVRSKSSAHKGHGVGLAICMRVVQWHKGEIRLGKNDELGGAEFVVTLPKVQTL